MNQLAAITAAQHHARRKHGARQHKPVAAWSSIIEKQLMDLRGHIKRDSPTPLLQRELLQVAAAALLAWEDLEERH